MSLSTFTLRNKIGLVLGPLLFILILATLDLKPGAPEVTRTAAAAALIATWWITEAIPIPVTSLLPLVLFPFLGIMRGKAVASTYMNSSIFLFMGGFVIALAMEKWQLHRRIALTIIGAIGDQPKRIILGFMIATAFLSMWVSNTATTMMMLSIGIAVVAQVNETRLAKDLKDQFALSLMLAIAYAASIGGIATLIGTPPNISFSRIFQITFPEAPPISFFKWFIMALPLSVVFLLLAWTLLVYFIAPMGRVSFFGGGQVIKEQKKQMGAVTYEEKAVFIVFVVTAFLWIFRRSINLAFITIPGWSNLLGVERFVDDGTVAITMAILLFLIPSSRKHEGRLMDWETAIRIPWGILLLFGGGFALAQGFVESGLSDWIGEGFRAYSNTAPALVIVIISLGVTFLTEITSNTATTEMILPILASVAVAIHIHPLLLMIPATLSASCAFMLPVATPPNAIVFGSGRVPITKMIRAGIFLNFLGVILIFLTVYFVGALVFGIDMRTLPNWVN